MKSFLFLFCVPMWVCLWNRFLECWVRSLEREVGCFSPASAPRLRCWHCSKCQHCSKCLRFNRVAPLQTLTLTGPKEQSPPFLASLTTEWWQLPAASGFWGALPSCNSAHSTRSSSFMSLPSFEPAGGDLCVLPGPYLTHWPFVFYQLPIHILCPFSIGLLMIYKYFLSNMNNSSQRWHFSLSLS